MLIRCLSGQTEFFSMTVTPEGGWALETGSGGANAKALAPRRVMAKAAMAIRVNIDGLQSDGCRSLVPNLAASSAIDAEQLVHLPFIFAAGWRRPHFGDALPLGRATL
ncbi:MAG TPA: hypothetical protein VMN43_07140 [Aestuariivirgaceae bacterium]|nr:hypothetical protein [Aestuariivirgaceae bacterium]